MVKSLSVIPLLLLPNLKVQLESYPNIFTTVLSSVAIIPTEAAVGLPPILGIPPHLKAVPKAALPFDVKEEPCAVFFPL